MRLALFSDIHSNLEALETAVAYCDSQKIDRWAVLGDTVGYGANPNECFEWALAHADIYVTGNHEKAVTDPAVREWFQDNALAAIIWTADVLKESLKEKISDLTYLRIEREMTFAHGSVNEPEEFHYVLNFKDAEPSFKKMRNRICFIGHTHVPSCFCEGARSVEHLKPGILQLQKGERYLLNPGSIGQPRDRDPRLSFGIFDDEKNTFEIVRLEYDNQKAARKIRAAGLPRFLADRLL